MASTHPCNRQRFFARPEVHAFTLRPLTLAVCGALFLASAAHAQTSAASGQVAPNRQHYDIPAGPLSAALRSAAATAGVGLTFTPDLTEGKTSTGLRGQYSLQEALSALLAGSGLESVRQANGGYAIRRVAGGAAVLPEVRVTSVQESPWGPVSGYVAKRTATGTKTDTPLIEVPQSISIVGAEEIETLKSQSITEALGYVAGVARQEGRDRTGDMMWIRGFQAANQLGSLYKDGLRYGVNSYNGQTDLYGLERIELLKGASSVLFGAAAPGGVVNMVSKRPTNTPQRELSVEVGSFDRKQIAGDFAGPLAKDSDWSYRMVFLKRDSNTFIDYVPDDRVYVAPSLKWQPSADISLTLFSEYQKDKTIYVDGLPAQGTVLSNPNGPIARSRFTGEPAYDKFNLERYSVGYLFEYAFNDHWKLRNSLRYFHAQNEYNYTWGWGLSGDLRSTGSRGVSERWDRSSDVVSDTSLQYQATHGNVQHTALVGLDYSAPRHESERYNHSMAALDLYAPRYGSTWGAGTENSGSWKEDTKRLGFYAQDQIKINEKWVVLFGGRYDSVRYNESAFFTGEKLSDNEKSSAFSGRAGLVYLADNGLAPFLSYSESFEPTSGRDRLRNRFEPTTGKQYEAGLRYQPKGYDTLLSVAVYELTRNKVQVTDPADATYMIQHGQVRSRGIELEARTRLGRNANLIFAYAYTDARTTQASPLQPEQQGQRTQNVPRDQLSVWGDYNLGSLGVPGMKVGVGVRYVGDVPGVAHGTTVTVPAFTLVDAMVGYTTGPWRFALNLTNLTDKTYIASCTYGCFYGEPRKAILSATYRW